MSRQNLPLDRPDMPSRREALFTARDLLLASVAAPALLHSKVHAAAAASTVQVVHLFADIQSITLWMQGASAQQVRVEVRPESGTGAPRVLRAALEPQSDYTAALRIEELESGTSYKYSVLPASGGASLASGTFRTQAHWQYRTDPPTVRIAAGSCAYLNDNKYDRPGKPYGGGEEIFDAIAGTSPDLMLWLGDNIYLRDPEWTSRAGISRRYRYYRSHATMRKLWQSTAHIAIWDDHDFGPDDSDASFVNREWTLEMFRRYWPLPYATPADGLYGMVTQGDVDIFLLDDRSYRFPDRWPESQDKAMYGPKQMLWLKQALVYSRAPFKIVCGGSQFFNSAARSEPTARYIRESWVNYPVEQQDFVRFLQEARMPGLLFLSGDRHFAEMLRIGRQGLYPLHEITTSPLTSGPPSDLSEAEYKNPDLVPDTLYKDRNFALITVSGPRTKRELTLELRDTQGGKRWEWRTTAAELAEGTRRS